MYPQLFTLPLLGWPVHSFGLMMVIGLLCAMELGKRLALRRGLDGEAMVNCGIIALIFGVVGARLSHVLENLADYTLPTRSVWENLKDAANLSAGGLTYYGGVLLAAPAVLIYLRWRKMPLLTTIDLAAPCLMIGLAFGRIGCFLNGCCYGQTCDLPWAVRFPYGSSAYVDQFQSGALAPPAPLVGLTEDGRLALEPRDRALSNPITRAAASSERSLPVHPAQLYSSVVAFLIAAIALTRLGLGKPAGTTFAMVLVLEGLARFVLESLRVEPRVLGPLSYSMTLGLGLAGVGILLWLFVQAFGPSRNPPPATPAPATPAP